MLAVVVIKFVYFRTIVNTENSHFEKLLRTEPGKSRMLEDIGDNGSVKLFFTMTQVYLSLSKRLLSPRSRILQHDMGKGLEFDTICY